MPADLRRAVRLLLETPGYAAATIVTLALAIGAHAAVFSAVDAVLLKPAAVREPGRLVVGWGSDPAHALPLLELTYRLVEAMGRDVRSFSRVGGMGSSAWPGWLKGRGARTRLSLAAVSGTFFDTVGADPVLGRTLRPEDDVPNAPPVVVLSHATWMTRFGGDRAIVGTRIDLNDQMQTVVGVMPRGFDVPRGADLWGPLAPALAAAGPDVLETVAFLYAIGRLAPGVTIANARDEMNRFIEGWTVAH